MLELNTWAGLEPAVMDIKTVSGLAQVFELTLTDSAGSAADLTGVSFRGAVNTAPLQEFVCSVEGGKLLFGWCRLPAGRHSFDLFAVTGGAERALLRGSMVVAGRVIPPLAGESYTVNDAATLVLPDTVDGVIRVELSEVGIVDLLSRRAGAFAEESRTCLKSIRDLKGLIDEKVDGFDHLVSTAGASIAEAGAGAVQAVNDAGVAATSVLATAKDGAVKAVKDVRGAAEKSIAEAGAGAVQAVNDAGVAATSVLATAKDGAVKAVKDAGSMAEISVGELVQQATEASSSAAKAADRASTAETNAGSSATAAQEALAAMPVDAVGNITAQGGTFARTVNANGGVNIPVDPVTAGDAVNLGNLPMSIFMPRHALTLLKSLWECYGNVEDTAGGIHIKDVVAGAFGGVCTRVMQWSDYASTATILTVITMTGGNGGNVLIDAAYNPNTGVSITPTTSPDKAFLPNAVQLSLFETRQGDTITGRLVGVDGTSVKFSVPSKESHSCVYRIFLLETGGVIKAYLGKFQSGMFDGVADVLARPEYLAETTVPNNPKRFCYLGIAGIQGGEGNSFSSRIPAISDVRRFYGPWLINLFS